MNVPSRPPPSAPSTPIPPMGRDRTEEEMRERMIRPEDEPREEDDWRLLPTVHPTEKMPSGASLVWLFLAVPVLLILVVLASAG